MKKYLFPTYKVKQEFQRAIDILAFDYCVEKSLTHILKNTDILKTVCQNFDISNDFIDAFQDYIDWTNLLWHKKLDQEIIEKCAEHYNKKCWELIFMFQTLDENFIEKYGKKYWKTISRYQDLNEIFIEKHENDIDWELMSDRYVYFTDVFIEKYKNKLNWSKISQTPMANNRIEKFKNLLDWENISIYQNLDEDMLYRFQSQIELKGIIRNTKIDKKIKEKYLENKIQYMEVNDFYILSSSNSQDFIEKHINEIPEAIFWQHISSTGKILGNEGKWARIDRKFNGTIFNIEFLDKYKNKLEWNIIVTKFQLSEEMLERYKKFIDINDIITCQKLSPVYIEKHLEEWKKLKSFDIIKYDLSRYQKLDEDFIKKHFNDLELVAIFKYQKLSEEFLYRNDLKFIAYVKDNFEKEHFIKYVYSEYIGEDCEIYIEKANICINRLFINFIAKYQKFTIGQISFHNPILPENNWNYITIGYKKDYFKKLGKYKINKNMVTAYVNIWDKNSPLYYFGSDYEIGKTYTKKCDFNSNDDHSFGLDCMCLSRIKKYYKDCKILKVEVNIKDLCPIYNGEILRCSKFKVIGEYNE